jgi:hypothetical protein
MTLGIWDLEIWELGVLGIQGDRYINISYAPYSGTSANNFHGSKLGFSDFSLIYSETAE